MDINSEGMIVISGMLARASETLFSAIKYIYLLSDEDFYNINVKDIFKIVLSDVTRTETLESLDIKFDKQKLGDMNNPLFQQVKQIIYYAFVVRLPFLRYIMPDCPLRENHFKLLFDVAVQDGAENHGDMVYGDLKTTIKMVKAKMPDPGFDGEWFRRWVYTNETELAAVNNRNMFLFGCVDALFPIFSSALDEKLIEAMKA